MIAEVALAGTSFPLEQIWTLLQSAGGGGLQGIVNVVFSAVGTEFATQALPLVTAAAADITTFLGAALTGVLSSGGVPIDFPGILTGVGTALGHGDFPGALQTLNGGLSAPITQVVQTVFGPDFQAFLATKVGTVLGAVPEMLRSAVQKVLGFDIKPVTDAIATALAGLVPSIPPGASVPVAPPAAEAVIRPIESVTQVPAVVSEALAAPGSAAAVSADVPVQSAPVEAPAGDVPAPKEAEVAVAAQAELDEVLTPPRVAHRGAAESAEDAGPAAAKPVAPHRGAADASAAAVERAGR